MSEGQDVQTLKMPGLVPFYVNVSVFWRLGTYRYFRFLFGSFLMPVTVARKHDDHDRRRSSTLRLEPLQSENARKATTSFVRARTSGVNRLLRSSTSSGGGVSGNIRSSSSSHSHSRSSKSKSGPNSKSADHETESDEVNTEVAEKETAELALESSAVNVRSSSALSPCASGGVNVDDDDVPSFFAEQIWTHVVLKMTAFSEEDAVTSFVFDTAGGGIGSSADNVASIPADKLLGAKDHARILYTSGRFYLTNGDHVGDTFVRLSPCETGDDTDAADRMQWPLDPHVSFRVGKSDFVVTAFHEPSQTLEVSALSGKLAGTQFAIGPEGAGIGRSAENKIHTGDGELSRKHAAIWFDELTNQFYLIDLNSTNGTFMKLVGSYQEPYRLEIGDDLLIAQTCLTVNRFDFGAHADMGARKYMEDSHTIIQDMCVESLSRLGLHPQSYFAVYDGHGGEEASLFLGEVLHLNIADAFYMPKAELRPLVDKSPEELQSMITKRLTDAFEQTDEEFLNGSERPQAGSTATTVLVAGNYIFVSNVGDSRTVLSRAGKAERLSNDHKPSRPDEAQRIRDTGGFVIHGRIMGELAVSRAFGDAPFKTFDLPEPPAEDVDSKPRSDYDSQELPINPNDILKGPLVIPTPEVTVTELTDDCDFLMLASDGLYDVMKDQEAVDFLRQKIEQLGDVQRAAEAIVEHAIYHQRSTDNVTCVVVMFKEPKKLES
uniref:PPM-type phosphatase domain-containing protein n=1 Tax=Hyaloperonospora arabidopsidis (strain Emoy2) TaxID=559515 RepID=M4BCH9_HYAAE